MSDKPTPLQDRLGSMVHAFSDDQRKYAVRLLAADVGKVERELNAANERIKRLEEALESIREYWNRDNNNRARINACWYSIDTASEALKAKEAKP